MNNLKEETVGAFAPDEALPSDYEACWECGFDHDYEYTFAVKEHQQMISAE